MCHYPELLRDNLGVETLERLGVSTTDVYEMFYELVRRVELPVAVFQEQTPETKIITEEPKKAIVKKNKK